MYNFSKKSIERMIGVDRRLIEITTLALKISKIDFGVPPFGGVRTESEQYKLFSDGLSQRDGIHKRSAHQYGLAIDLFAYVDGKASWDIGHMAQVAAAMLQAAIKLGYKIQWGGFWDGFSDTPHFEIIEENKQ